MNDAISISSSDVRDQLYAFTYSETEGVRKHFSKDLERRLDTRDMVDLLREMRVAYTELRELFTTRVEDETLTGGRTVLG